MEIERGISDAAKVYGHNSKRWISRPDSSELGGRIFHSLDTVPSYISPGTHLRDFGDRDLQRASQVLLV